MGSAPAILIGPVWVRKPQFYGWVGLSGIIPNIHTYILLINKTNKNTID
jgi:hypothetical protein